MIILDIRFHTSHFLSADAPWDCGCTLISLLAYSLLAMASVQSILLAVQDHHHLRHRHPGGFIRSLPPLQTMEALLFEMIGQAFCTAYPGTAERFHVSGGYVLRSGWHTRQCSRLPPGSCLIPVMGQIQIQDGARQKALIWTLTGFVVLMLAYFSSKFVLELVLS